MRVAVRHLPKSRSAWAAHFNREPPLLRRPPPPPRSQALSNDIVKEALKENSFDDMGNLPRVLETAPLLASQPTLRGGGQV